MRIVVTVIGAVFLASAASAADAGECVRSIGSCTARAGVAVADGRSPSVSSAETSCPYWATHHGASAAAALSRDRARPSLGRARLPTSSPPSPDLRVASWSVSARLIGSRSPGDDGQGSAHLVHLRTARLLL